MLPNSAKKDLHVKNKVVYLFMLAVFAAQVMVGNVQARGLPSQETAPALAAASCTFTTWSAGINYPLGTVVKYNANGSFYKLVNVGTNGSDGTDPTISTWYWQPTQCDATPPSGGCTFTVWAAGVNYPLGTVVKYNANGN